MHKYGIKWTIRRTNPYRDMLKKGHEDLISPNVLNMEFKLWAPLRKVWTDITYIKCNEWFAYLSIWKDMITWEILSYLISKKLWLDLWLKVAEEVIKKGGEWVLIHSDQWIHYTNIAYCNLLKQHWAIQSMSRKWRCIDNAPTESFFGHMKDELWTAYRRKSYEEVVKMLTYYNYKRRQRTRNQMIPIEYKNYLLNN